MRLSVARIKNPNYSKLPPEPRSGTKIRKLYDELVSGKTVKISTVRDFTMVAYLRNNYGLEIIKESRGYWKCSGMILSYKNGEGLV